MEELFKLWTGYFATGIESIAGLIITFAALQATIQVLLLICNRRENIRPNQEPGTELIRLRMGRWLALALEFELGADILRTAITPTWSQIGQLAAIATIRTLLNYFLQQEIDRATISNQPEKIRTAPTPQPKTTEMPQPQNCQEFQ